MNLFSLLTFCGIGAFALPAAMFALLHLFALAGGDLAQLLGNWATAPPRPVRNELVMLLIVYAQIGALLGGFAGVVFLGLNQKKGPEGAGLGWAFGAVASLVLTGGWVNSATNRAGIMEAVVLHGLPTAWFVVLLFLIFKRLIRKPEAA